jgi:dTDP-4-dehydrorhamnose reductase
VRILVTGADGLLGSALCPVLAKNQHEVFGVSEGDGDIFLPETLRPRLAAFRPQALVHLAAWTDVDGCEGDPDRAHRVNAEGARVAAAEAERAGASVLIVSSDYVFPGTGTAPCREDDATGPAGVYGQSKLAGEEAVKQAAVAWTVVRSAWLFGPGGKNFVDTVIALARTRERVPVVADQTGSPTYTPDLAKGLLQLIEARVRGTFHVTNGGAATWFTLAREAVRLAGGDPERIVPASTAEIGRPAPRPAYSVLDTAKAAAHGVVLRPWPEALAAYVGSQGRSVGWTGSRS